MSLRSRLQRMGKYLSPPSAVPLTLFLREAEPGLPVGERIVWEGRGREIVFDPATGWLDLPPGDPHKLILGMDPDWV